MILRWIERGCYGAGGLLALAAGPAPTVATTLGFGVAGIGLLLLGFYLTDERQACERIERMSARQAPRARANGHHDDTAAVQAWVDDAGRRLRG